MPTQYHRLSATEEIIRMGVTSKRYHDRHTVVNDPYAEHILPLNVEQSPAAPIPGFVPRMSNLKAVALEMHQDVYDRMDHAVSAGEITKALQAKGISELQLVHDANKSGKPQHIQSIPLIGWVLHPDSKRFCNYPDDIRVGIELPMSDYHWTGLDTIGNRMMLFVEKMSVVGNQHRKSLRLHLAYFGTTYVTSGINEALWNVYYHANQPCSNNVMLVDVFETDRYGRNHVPLGKVTVLSNATPKYLVNNGTGNVYQLVKADTSLKVLHIGYVPPVILRDVKVGSNYYNLPR